MVDMYFAVTDDKRFVYIDSMGEINGDNVKKHLTNLNDLKGEDSNLLWEESATRCIDGTGVYKVQIIPIEDSGYLGAFNGRVEFILPIIQICAVVDMDGMRELMGEPRDSSELNGGTEKCQNSK